MDSVLTSAPASGSATDRINGALATLRSEMADLRQQDVMLMKQLININDTIQSLAKRRPSSHRPLKKKLSFVNGRREFVNSDESIPEHSTNFQQKRMTWSFSGSFCSIDSSSSTEDMGCVDSDSDESFCGTEQNLSDSFASVTSRSLFVAKIPETDDLAYEEIFRRNIKLWKFSQSESFEQPVVS
ncbi:uncharacterized protein LOC110447675 [Mizuhopecten yessoensis]|uniref:Uncharacterized protein n=1 Tax=Mizuhopecten yessoensis TaxID=6573 RepID=A0A210QUQ5_MIZYE|nr:uncharacterized protein LOC110447675 [Mizuhopecten yessoensis]OWF52478.1 hypothetical protein KP79_PYT06864 [Mizuhopecten yessoensis]